MADGPRPLIEPDGHAYGPLSLGFDPQCEPGGPEAERALARIIRRQRARALRVAVPPPPPLPE